MQINELPSLGRALQSGDQLAVDDVNGITYKVDAENINPTPVVISIPTGRWSGSGSDYYITVTASNVTANSILIPQYDVASAALLNGPVWCVPAAGSFTIHTSAKPSGTVTILVLFPGTMGEAQYEVLADVYSKSQVDSIVAQSTATGEIRRISYGSASYVIYCKSGNVVYLYAKYVPSDGAISAWASVTIGTLPVGYRPKFECRTPATTDRAASVGSVISVGTNGAVTIAAHYNAISDSNDRVDATMMFLVA